MSPSTFSSAIRQWWVLIGAGVLVVVLAFLSVMIQSPKSQNSHSVPSTYDTGKQGLKAWHQAASIAKLPIFLWQKPFHQLSGLPPSTTLVMIGPHKKPLKSDDVTDLLKWVQAGNTLILLDNFQGKMGKKLAGIFHLKTNGRSSKNDKQFRLKLPTALPSNWQGLKQHIYHPIHSQQQQVLIKKKPLENHAKWQPLLLNPTGKPVLVEILMGKGRIIAGTPIDIAANQYLHPLEDGQATSNLQFFTNLITLNSSNTNQAVFINEWIHGYSDHPNLLAYYTKGRLGPAFFQGLLLVLALFWLSAVRSIPMAVAPSESTSPGTQSYIHSMSTLYRRAGATSLALYPLLANIDQTLRQKYHINPTDLDAVKLALQDILPSKRVEKTLAAMTAARQNIQRQEKMPRSQLLVISQTLSQLQQHWKK
ncbi:MAG: DUF4350 domain-containing protein [Vampirovibrio sp.]|nr:DUF4350 domain-containing protein [Vampirovibrio sp.]